MHSGRKSVVISVNFTPRVKWKIINPAPMVLLYQDMFTQFRVDMNSSIDFRDQIQQTNRPY